MIIISHSHWISFQAGYAFYMCTAVEQVSLILSEFLQTRLFQTQS